MFCSPWKMEVKKFVELKDYSVGFDRNTYYNFSVLNNAKIYNCLCL